MINPSDLTWFMEIANKGNMTRASERLGVSQPALSHWLKNLESNLKRPLFRRGQKGMELTQFGEKLKQHATVLQQSWEDFMQAVESDESGLNARFRFGIHVSVALFALPAIYRSLQATAPGIHLSLTHGLSRHVAEDIINRRLDLGLVVNPVRHPDLVIKELYKDKVMAWSLPKTKSKAIIYHPGIAQSQTLLKLLTSAQEKIETESLEVAAHMALAGIGTAILPERVAKILGEGKLKVVEDAAVVDHHCLVYRPSLRETPAGKALIAAIQESNFG